MTVTTPPLRPLWRQLTWWTLAFPVVMIVAIARHDIYLLNWIHVLSGALWTGAELFMGFILGPVLRKLDMRARTALIAYLVPRTLLYFPMVSLTAGTTGWFLVDWFGFTTSASPMYHLVVISLALVAVMTVVGLGFLLPNSVRIWRELRRPEPDRERIVRINGINIWLAGMQGPVANRHCSRDGEIRKLKYSMEPRLGEFPNSQRRRGGAFPKNIRSE